MATATQPKTPLQERIESLSKILIGAALIVVATIIGIGIATGMGEMLSAWMQGAVGAAGIRAMSEGEGKGFAFIIIALGIVETVGIFAMVFLLGMIPAIP